MDISPSFDARKLNDHTGFFHDPETLFLFLGHFVAKAMLDRQLVGVNLAPRLLKAILGKEQTKEDVKDADPSFVKSMDWILMNDVSGVLYETFAVVVRERMTLEGAMTSTLHDLSPNGRNIEVNNDNKKEYVDLMYSFKVKECSRQYVGAFVRGFHDIISLDSVQVFDEYELDLLISGNPKIVVDDIRNGVIYQGARILSHTGHSLIGFGK